MKKLALILGFVFACFMFAEAQRTVSDTLNGNEYVNFTSMYNAQSVSCLCTQIGGTSDGYLMLQGSIDNVSFATIPYTSTQDFWHNSAADDSLTITNGAIWIMDLSNLKYPYYRIRGDGTASDSTLITIKWSK